MTSKFYLNFSFINKNFFDNYIKDHVQKNLQKRCDKILEDYEFIECYSIGLKSECIACYNELWLLDINMDEISKEKGMYLPIFIENINTSSCYALERCSMDNNSINEENYKSLDELLIMCPKSCRSQLSKILYLDII